MLKKTGFATKRTHSSFPWLRRSDPINQAGASSRSSGQHSRQPRHSNKPRTLPLPPHLHRPSPSFPPIRSVAMCEPCYQNTDVVSPSSSPSSSSSLRIKFTPLSVCPPFPGGHENFRKMIDEAEPLGYPVVVKNARGHRGKTLVTAQRGRLEGLHSATPPRPRRPLTAARPTLP